MNLGGVAGPQDIANGAGNTVALGRQSELLVTELHGKYYQQAVRGLMLHAVSAAITVAAANVSPLAAAGTPILALYNPPNSGRNLALLKHHVATISGQPGGPLLWNYALAQAITAAGLSGISGNLSIGSQGVGRVFSGAALTGSTLMAVLKIASGLSAATAAVAAPIIHPPEAEEGALVIPPGGILALAAYAVGTSHVVMASLAWEEAPI